MGVRKNAANLTEQERDRFVNATKGLKNTIQPGSTISIYDQFVAMHLGVYQRRNVPGGVDGGHRNAAFLPWHREYLRRFEMALQAVDPDVSLPYWDWTNIDSSRNVVFQDDFMGPNGGQGGRGGGPVQSGHFSLASGWRVDPRLHVSSWGGQSLGAALMRDMGPFVNLPRKEDVDTTLNIDSYTVFRPALERAPLHNSIHPWVGGSMAMMSSPNDPIFFMHHANVDRIWAEWQDGGHSGPSFYPTVGQPYGHNLNDRMWPWDGGQSRTVSGLRDLVQVPEANDIVTPGEVLEYRTLGYTYDTSTPGIQVPQLTISGAPVRASIGTSGEENHFALRITSAGYYRIETQGSTDTVMSLYDSGDRINPIAQDDDGGVRTNARVIRRLGVGDYFVIVRHYSARRTGDYEILAQAEPAPTEPILIPVNGPAVQASIGESGEVDVFRFEVPTMAFYTIQTSGPTDIIMSLFGPDNPRILVTTDDDSGANSNAKIASRLTAGIYFLEIQHYSPRGTGNYNISVKSESQSIPQLEVNGEEVEAAIDAANESDLYTFTAPSAGRYVIQTSGITDTFLSLFGPNSQTTIIVRDDDSGPERNARIDRNVEEATYYIRIRHYRPTGTGTYGISVRRE